MNEFIIKKKICYARVSSSKQKDDLTRQKNDLKYLYPNHEIISDIGSRKLCFLGIEDPGLNWNIGKRSFPREIKDFLRKGLRNILDSTFKNEIEEVIILYRDRLCRFGFELLEYIFNTFKVKLIVVNTNLLNGPTSELSEDLLAVVNFFVARNNGRRAGENKRNRILHT